MFAKPTAILALAASVTAITPIGCWSDSDYRALASNYTSTPTMTAEQCAKYCIGYNIFGTEDANQCFCGNQLLFGSIFQDPARVGCTSPCVGNSAEMCGGIWALSLYIH